MMKTLGYGVMLLLGVSTGVSQTLTFSLRNAQVIAGPKFQYEVWIKSSDGTSRMGSILVYNNYNTLAFGVSVASSGNATVTKNATMFGTSYAQNPTNDNTASRFAYSWTYLGGTGSGVVIPSTGDGILAFTVQINIIDTNQHAGLTYEQSLMEGEEYKDEEITPWPVVDASDFLDPPLPIQLSSFTGVSLSDGHVRLDWTTLSEINNYGFEVQRKMATEENFLTLTQSFIPGHGTTNEPHSYSFIDSTATPSHWNYRLKLIDLDGAVHYTDPIAVNVLTAVADVPTPAEFTLNQNYPNPFNPSTLIRYALPTASHVTLGVYSALGQLVTQLVNGQQQAGYHEARFSGEGLASGAYFCRIQAGDFVATRKLLMLK